MKTSLILSVLAFVSTLAMSGSAHAMGSSRSNQIRLDSVQVLAPISLKDTDGNAIQVQADGSIVQVANGVSNSIRLESLQTGYDNMSGKTFVDLISSPINSKSAHIRFRVGKPVSVDSNGNPNLSDLSIPASSSEQGVGISARLVTPGFWSDPVRSDFREYCERLIQDVQCFVTHQGQTVCHTITRSFPGYRDVVTYSSYKIDLYQLELSKADGAAALQAPFSLNYSHVDRREGPCF